jgi:hypothetical protein
MADSTDYILALLRQAVHDDPTLQARLFALTDPAEFVAAVRRLALSPGHELAEADVLQAMRAGRKAWTDRTLP